MRVSRVKGSFNNKITRKLEIKIIIEIFRLFLILHDLSFLKIVAGKRQNICMEKFFMIKKLFITVISSRFKGSAPQKISSSSHSLYSSIWKFVFGVLVSSVMMLKGIKYKRELVIISIGSKVITIPSR